MSSRLTKVAGEKFLYKDTNGTYYMRIQGEGRDTHLTLGTRKITQAVKARDARMAAKAAARLGIAVEPDEAAPQATVCGVVKRYQADGYPDRKGAPRTESKHLRSEQDACAKLLEFFEADFLVDDLTQDILDRYHSWRKENVIRGTGERTTDLELNTLNNALKWAKRKQFIHGNPLEGRVRFHSSTNARHCRELAPANADELHEIAGCFFAHRQSETLGWQVLFEGLTGLRTNEVLALRIDARADEPGGLTEDGRSMCVRRSKKAGRDNPFVEVHDGLSALLKAHKKWHTWRYPESSWYFPGRDKAKPKPVSKEALTKALDRLFDDKMVGKKFVSHGMRAFYVLVRRSHGISDAQIAWEINHVGGVGTLERVYGGVPPHWMNGKGPKLSWIPKKKPAWTKIQASRKDSPSK